MNQNKNRLQIRHQLADAAKRHDWQKTLEILRENSDLINATRPGGQPLYTPLHQAVYGNAPRDAIRGNLEKSGSWPHSKGSRRRLG